MKVISSDKDRFVLECIYENEVREILVFVAVGLIT